MADTIEDELGLDELALRPQGGDPGAARAGPEARPDGPRWFREHGVRSRQDMEDLGQEALVAFLKRWDARRGRPVTSSTATSSPA